ncbi:MAG: hypothetical protein O3A00_20720 [Planctomycetota bacterium]|nr:hypothetical protein [Planctomycetota bacterium]
MTRFRSFAQCVAVLSLGLMITGCAKKACSTCPGDGGGGWSEAPSQFYSGHGSIHDHGFEDQSFQGGSYGESVQPGAISYE